MKQLNLSRAETEAVRHVEAIRATGHVHSDTSCPPLTRSICRRRRAYASALDKVGRADLVLDADGQSVGALWPSG